MIFIPDGGNSFFHSSIEAFLKNFPSLNFLKDVFSIILFINSSSVFTFKKSNIFL